MSEYQSDPVLVELDEDGRAPLAGLAAEARARYLAHTEADGTIVLVPAELLESLEESLHANRHVIETIRQNRADPERLVRRPPRRPS